MSESSTQPKESPCPDCGEMVRVNSLRCWNCGAFMNPELEQKFMEMQSNPAPPLLSELPQEEVSSYEEDDDEDFELSMPVAKSSAKEGTAGTPVVGGEEEAASPLPSTPDGDVSQEQQEESGVAHSEATGGDALLDIAMQEEKETRKRRKGRMQTGGMRTPGGGLIIFCPYGCRIEVKEQHRGMTGRCPRCRAPFIVPVDPPQFKKPKAEEEAEQQAAASGGFDHWLHDLHLHVVNPEKLKLKADSLAKDFAEVDLGFSKEQLVVALLARKGTKLKDEKKQELRETVTGHLQEGKPMEELPAAEKYVFSSEELSQLKVVQPTATRAESVFMGIPVFGEGRIAVQLPITEQSQETLYLSMGLTQFWDFAKAVEEHYGMTDLGKGAGIPPEHVYSDYKCHYTDTPIKALENMEFYKADPTVELEVAGYRCGACGLAVSEAGRKKESLGGKSPKGIAKAKCPKCGSKMGENFLQVLKSDLQEPAMSGN
jgi:DNA-directed RNA polymerase subunit RPC12/RpoP